MGGAKCVIEPLMLSLEVGGLIFNCAKPLFSANRRVFLGKKEGKKEGN